VAVIAFWPTPVDRDFRGLLFEITDFFGARGMPWAETYRLIEFVANILFFLPFGALVTWVSGRWWVGIVLGVLVAATIELVQAAALPERFSTLQDVVANSLGAALGAGLAIVIGLVTGLRRRRPPATP
jgi:glycopeptide antibiotics resistance protein